MIFRADLVGWRLLLSRWEKAAYLLSAAAQLDALKEVAEKIAEAAREMAPKAFGDLIESIVVEEHPTWVAVLVKAPYGGYVEFGTKPHWPPLEAVRAWAELKGWTAEEIQAGIAKKGTPAQPFFIPAWEKYEDEVPVAFRGKIQKLWKRV